jgi:hypothetical protein
MTDIPAIVKDARLEILTANQLGYALYAPLGLAPGRTINIARRVFLDDRSHDFFSDWEEAAQSSVALLRAEAGRNPHDRELTDLVGELATRSEPFRQRWAAHAVRAQDTGTKHLHHPVVGELILTFEGMEPKADPGLTLVTYTPEPGSKTEEALRLLGTWAATAAASAPPAGAGTPETAKGT